jgi:2-hydroxychromene-2-carboxylate isomerase
MLKAVWADESNIADEQDVRRALLQIGMNADDLLALAAGESAHTRYEANTQEALQAEVFGAPWYIFDGVPFWGQDRLDFLERAFAAAKPG